MKLYGMGNSFFFWEALSDPDMGWDSQAARGGLAEPSARLGRSVMPEHCI